MSWVIDLFAETWAEALSEEERVRLVEPLLERATRALGSPAADARLGQMVSQWALEVHAPAWLRLAGFHRFAEVLSMGVPTEHPCVRMPKAILQSMAAALDQALFIEREALALRALGGDQFAVPLLGHGSDLWILVGSAAERAIGASAGDAALITAGATQEAGTELMPLNLLAAVAEKAATLAALAAAERSVFDGRTNDGHDSRLQSAEVRLATTTNMLKHTAYELMLRMMVEAERLSS